MTDLDSREYVYAGQPLTPSVMAELAAHLFSGRNAKRVEIARAVVDEHLRRGGLPSTADPLMQMKKALASLLRAGRVEQDSGFGRWSFPDIESEMVEAETLPEIDDLEDEDEPVEVEKWFGTGSELVYVYSYPAYKELATLTGKSAWPLKIGRSSSANLDRVTNQVATAVPEWPVVHIAIRCSDSRSLEKMLHSVLKVREEHVTSGPGSEWFVSSPEWILDHLKRSTPNLF